MTEVINCTVTAKIRPRCGVVLNENDMAPRPALFNSVFHCEATLYRRSESCLCFNVVSGSHSDIIASESEYNPSGVTSMTELPVKNGK